MNTAQHFREQDYSKAPGYDTKQTEL